ncbi:MAG TPA: response regulator transcription factor [Bryobacteraceae bacterium]|nr:response regulator transcription factor [Bryobacteraceae bacterium]
MRVLVAEDKPRMARFLQRALQSEGYSVEVAFDGEQALSMGLSGGLDLLVLDVMLPRRDGFDVIKNLRAAKQMVPTLILSARDTRCDIVRGLDLGADDYLTKPFPLDVMLARVRALARRGPITYSSDLHFEDVVLNHRTHELRRKERTVTLTRTEYALMEALMRRAGCIVPRDVLAEAGWGGGEAVSDATLYVFMRALRSKIAQPGERQFLYTVRGVGYTLRTDAP